MTIILPDLATQNAALPVTGYNSLAPGVDPVVSPPSPGEMGPAIAIARRDHWKIAVPENTVTTTRRDVSIWNDFSVGVSGINVAPQQPANPLTR